MRYLTPGLAVLISLSAHGCTDSGVQGQELRFVSVLAPVRTIEPPMAVYLNQFEPKEGGDSWSTGETLPSDEALSLEAQGEAVFVVEGQEFTMSVDAYGIVDAPTMTDPLASTETGEVQPCDTWDVWLNALAPSVVPIQFGYLEQDPEDPSHFTLEFDSRTDTDFFGEKVSVNSVTSIDTAYPEEAVGLFDVQNVAIDCEATISEAPGEPSGQNRLSDTAPTGQTIDWSQPTPQE